MQKIPLKLAKAGMVLAKPVLRDNGLVLMAEGTELSESLLPRLENMGIETLVVKGNPVDLGGAGGSTAFTERAARMEHLFRKFKADPWMSRLKDHLVQYFTLKAAAEAAEQAALAEAEQAGEAEEGNGDG